MTEKPWLGEMAAEARAGAALDYAYDKLDLKDWELVLTSAIRDAEMHANRADLAEARAHLLAALRQAQPEDDAILVEHMRATYRLIGGRLDQ